MDNNAKIVTYNELIDFRVEEPFYLEFVDQPELIKVKICQIESHKKLFRWKTLCCFCSFGECGQIAADFRLMGKLWRCWTKCPTDEQRKEMKWK